MSIMLVPVFLYLYVSFLGYIASNPHPCRSLFIKNLQHLVEIAEIEKKNCERIKSC